jgi:hypothetical protein
MDGRDVGDGPDFLQLLELARLFQVPFELEGPVEVVFDGPLAASGDDEDVGDPGPRRVLDHVLDGGLVHQGQHLLRL